MKKLTLDYSTWRCGGDGDNKVGNGPTYLLNEQGFMCCLGQFALQVNPEVLSTDIRDLGMPGQVSKIIEGFSEPDNSAMIPCNMSTRLSRRLVDVNDGWSTTAEEKIELLTEHLAEAGYELEVINKPE